MFSVGQSINQWSESAQMRATHRRRNALHEKLFRFAQPQQHDLQNDFLQLDSLHFGQVVVLHDRHCRADGGRCEKAFVEQSPARAGTHSSSPSSALLCTAARNKHFAQEVDAAAGVVGVLLQKPRVHHVRHGAQRDRRLRCGSHVHSDNRNGYQWNDNNGSNGNALTDVCGQHDRPLSGSRGAKDAALLLRRQPAVQQQDLQQKMPGKTWAVDQSTSI